MKSWKLVVLGGLALFVATFIVSLGTGPLIHNGVLKETYRANAQFWRPELNQEPPDMAALMPRWITTWVLASFILAAIYGCVRGSLSGPGWKKGLTYGLILGGFGLAWGVLGYSGVFNLPDKIWIWWAAEAFVLYMIGGAVMGWLAEKFSW